MQLLLFATFNADSKFKGKKHLKEALNSSVSNHVPVVQDYITNMLYLHHAYLEWMQARLCLITGFFFFFFFTMRDFFTFV